jgi:hypothetical protein
MLTAAAETEKKGRCGGCWSRMTAPIVNVFKSGTDGSLTGHPCDERSILTHSRLVGPLDLRYITGEYFIIICHRSNVWFVPGSGHYVVDWCLVCVAAERQPVSLDCCELCHDTIQFNVLYVNPT